LDLPISGGENLVANMASNYTKIIGEQHIGFSVLFFLIKKMKNAFKRN
jgi:hypothetical protein